MVCLVSYWKGEITMSYLKSSVEIIVLFAFFFLAACVSGCGHGGSYYEESSVTLIGHNFDICIASRDQRAPACAYNSVGDEYIVTWQDRRTGTDYDIFAVILESSAGSPVFPEIWVTSAADDQSAPSVAHNSFLDEYLIVWEDRQSTTDYDIYAQFIDGATGLPIGSNFAVSSVIGRDERAPRVVYNDTDNNYLVVWDEESSGGDTDILGQILSADGSPLGGAFVICDYSGNQQSPAVAFNSNYDEYLIVWMDFRYSSLESDIFAEIRDKYGALVRDDFDVNADSGDQDFPAVAYNPDTDRYLVVWEDWRYPGPDIYAQEVYSDGILYGQDFVITFDEANQRLPAVCYNTTKRKYLIAWQDDYYSGTTDTDICALILDTYAYPIGRIKRISDEAVPHIEPTVCANTAFSEYLTVWSGRLTTDYDILGQLLR